MQRRLLRRWPRRQIRWLQLQRAWLSLRSCNPGVSSANGGGQHQSVWMSASLRGAQRLAGGLQMHSLAQSQQPGSSCTGLAQRRPARTSVSLLREHRLAQEGL